MQRSINFPRGLSLQKKKQKQNKNIKNKKQKKQTKTKTEQKKPHINLLLQLQLCTGGCFKAVSSFPKSFSNVNMAMNIMIYFRTQTLTSSSLPPPQFALCHIPNNNQKISFLLGPLRQMNVSSFEDWLASLRKLWLRHTSSCLMSSRERGEFCGICYVLPSLTSLQRKTLGMMRNYTLGLCT